MVKIITSFLIFFIKTTHYGLKLKSIDFLLY